MVPYAGATSDSMSRKDQEVAKSTTKYEPAVEKRRAFSVVVYDLQGGPIPPSVVQYLEDAAFNAAQMSSGLAITTAVE